MDPTKLTDSQRHALLFETLDEFAQLALGQTWCRTSDRRLYIHATDLAQENEILGAMLIAHETLAELGYEGICLIGSPAGFVSTATLGHAFQLQWQELGKGLAP